MSKAEAQTRPAHQQNWDWRAACNFIGGGSGAGLVVCAAAAREAGGPYALLVVAGLALVAFGLMCVWLETGRPWRAMNVTFHPGTSWMTRESWVAPLVFAAGGMAVWQGGAWPWLAAALAFAFLYCQARILRAAKGIPAWREPRLVPLMLATGLTEGVALAILLVTAAGQHAVGIRLAAVLFAAVLLRGAAWRAYRSGFSRRGAPQRTLDALKRIEPSFNAIGNWGVALIVLSALAIPADSLSAGLASAAALVAFASGWRFKFALITQAAYNQGFALPALPVRGRGKPGPAAKPGW